MHGLEMQRNAIYAFMINPKIHPEREVRHTNPFGTCAYMQELHARCFPDQDNPMMLPAESSVALRSTMSCQAPTYILDAFKMIGAQASSSEQTS